jgi:hypothetical protein
MYERPCFGPSHVEDGGGDILEQRNQAVNHWRIQSPIPQVELPTERWKKELKKVIEEAQHSLELDDRFLPFAWRLTHMDSGLQRDKAISKLWRQAYEEHPPEDDSGVFRSFTINDLLQARDEVQ